MLIRNGIKLKAETNTGQSSPPWRLVFWMPSKPGMGRAEKQLLHASPLLYPFVSVTQFCRGTCRMLPEELTHRKHTGDLRG